VHLAREKESLAKVRQEFGKNAATLPCNRTLKECLRETVTYENCKDLSYLSSVTMEALRIMPPIPFTTPATLSQDAKIGKFNVKAGDDIMINITGLHMHSREWQRPYEFLPQRFDNNDPLSLTADGKKRNPMSWVPFNGGKRVCFGKTFAEVNLKIVTTYLSQYFNFNMVDNNKNSNGIGFPLC